MLIIVLMVALMFYVWMYWIWDSAQVPLDNAAGVLTRLNHILLMPEPNIFVILRGLILITLFYVMCDFLYTSARNGLRKANEGASCPVKYQHRGSGTSGR